MPRTSGIRTMTPFRWLRIIIIASWVLLVLGVTLDGVLEPRLPESLQAWNRVQYERSPTDLEFMAYAVGFAALLASVVGAIALFNRRRWGARTYLIATIAGALTILGTGPAVTHPAAELAFEVELVVEGLIIGLAFFSSALDPDDGLPKDLDETFS